MQSRQQLIKTINKSTHEILWEYSGTLCIILFSVVLLFLLNLLLADNVQASDTSREHRSYGRSYGPMEYAIAESLINGKSLRVSLGFLEQERQNYINAHQYDLRWRWNTLWGIKNEIPPYIETRYTTALIKFDQNAKSFKYLVNAYPEIYQKLLQIPDLSFLQKIYQKDCNFFQASIDIFFQKNLQDSFFFPKRYSPVRYHEERYFEGLLPNGLDTQNYNAQAIFTFERNNIEEFQAFSCHINPLNLIDIQDLLVIDCQRQPLFHQLNDVNLYLSIIDHSIEHTENMISTKNLFNNNVSLNETQVLFSTKKEELNLVQLYEQKNRFRNLKSFLELQIESFDPQIKKALS